MEQGLTTTMVLDQHFTAGRVFGDIGTPSAVLVDAEVRIASEVAVGAPKLSRSRPSRIVASPDGAKSIGGSFGC